MTMLCWVPFPVRSLSVLVQDTRHVFLLASKCIALHCTLSSICNNKGPLSSPLQHQRPVQLPSVPPDSQPIDTEARVAVCVSPTEGLSVWRQVFQQLEHSFSFGWRFSFPRVWSALQIIASRIKDSTGFLWRSFSPSGSRMIKGIANGYSHCYCSLEECKLSL